MICDFARNLGDGELETIHGLEQDLGVLVVAFSCRSLDPEREERVRKAMEALGPAAAGRAGERRRGAAREDPRDGAVPGAVARGRAGVTGKTDEGPVNVYWPLAATSSTTWVRPGPVLSSTRSQSCSMMEKPMPRLATLE